MIPSGFGWRFLHPNHRGWGIRRGIHLDALDRLLLLSREELDQIMAEYQPPEVDTAPGRERILRVGREEQTNFQVGTYPGGGSSMYSSYIEKRLGQIRAYLGQLLWQPFEARVS